MNVDLSGARWFKSTRSGNGGECVEVAHLTAHVAVRDSKNPTGPALIFTPSTWDAFLTRTRTGLTLPK
ncbi:DUF397 domain-containing protein [Nocardia cyriacigeorgica]|uniref:DUF397 domain-containing protein n=1 Tax=Nocardia cyriacigeorgica TaxID=135487 RepID=UPI0002FDA4C4|nr:DUF397 domain-containing protein [Nocardia cyriacigeorgica]AVH24324.1 DUF397 domain-containing protein [Nocardia cyriacigeorgica]MBF6323727.1 DUF397 domain-containing protein [Nocardia cyriacigeorgica]MBF6496316.1 DUF397 domain-containing protein [Nocardia cyriacigeorgica]PPJ16071.1 DUF397 domain-containing protein [Nocardia cyriacigeorgica]TLF59094.1 DUF397 domain-containing protein [Nocardia cyriacigeorgica]